MGKGRKAIPTELKRLMGNPGKRPLPVGEPKFTTGIPHCPSWLKGEARAMWNRVTSELAGAKLLTIADEGVLVGYCLAYSQLKRAQALIDQGGVVTETRLGGLIKHPAVTVKNEALTQLRAYGSELGLSPVARTRLQTPTREDDDYEQWDKQTATA